VTGELEGLVAEYPVRERLWRLLVLALHRAERQPEALAAYRRARAVLAEELGIEPGEELRQLEGAVLRQEVPPPATAAVTRTLPRDTAGFTGRGAELRQLAGQLASVAADGGVVGICAIGGGWPGLASPYPEGSTGVSGCQVPSAATQPCQVARDLR
jgi:Bacterial transcriptional activator domain